jgi:hypothetical protein
MAAYGLSTWEWIHACSSCERAYFGSTFGSTVRGKWSAHPLLNWRRTEVPPIGYVRSNVPPTDSWGWFTLST